MLFDYTASDSQGQSIRGSIEASDFAEAKAKVQELGLLPRNIAISTTPSQNWGNQEPTRRLDFSEGNAAEPVLTPLAVGGRPGIPPHLSKAGYGVPATSGLVSPPLGAEPETGTDWILNHLVYPFWTGVGLQDQAAMYRQMAAMSNSGLSMHHAISTLLERNESITLRRCLSGLRKRVKAGVPLSVAMSKYSGLFPDFHRSVIAAGEATGELNGMLQLLAESLESDFRFRWELFRELFVKGMFMIGNFIAWPLIVLWYTKSYLMMFLLIAVILLVVLSILGFYALARIFKQVRPVYDAILAKTPGLAGMANSLAISRFCRILSTLYAAGIPISTAAIYAADGCGNYTLGQAYRRCVVPLQRGAGLVEAFRMAHAFPDLLVSMLVTAQETGSLSVLVDKVAEHYEGESILLAGKFAITVGVVTTVVSGIFFLLVDLLTYKLYLGNAI
jgi:type II secretory pathway component PulF